MDGAPPKITVVIVGRNSPVLKQSLLSVAFQNYPNYEVFLLDDASDSQRQHVALAEQVLRRRFAGATTSAERIGKVALYKRTLPLIRPDRFVVNLDADDYFIRKDALSAIARCLKGDVWFVFGKHRDLNGVSCVGEGDGKGHAQQLLSSPRGYSLDKWFDHPHCAYNWLLSAIPESALRVDERYPMVCADQYLFTQAMELAGADRVRCTGKYIYEYRYPTPHNVNMLSCESFRVDATAFLARPRLKRLERMV